MNRYRFYAEMPASRGSKSASKYHGPFTREALQRTAGEGRYVNCVAVPLDAQGRPYWQGNTLNMDVFAAARDTGNSPVEGNSVSRDYLRKRCVRISEELARKLHPNLFKRLEM